MAAPFPPEALQFFNDIWNRLPVADLLPPGFRVALGPGWDPSEASWTAQGREPFQQQMGRAGLSVPFQEWAQGSTPVLSLPPTPAGPAGAYAHPFLPLDVTKYLGPMAYSPIPAPGTVLSYGGNPSVLAHELLHAHWYRGMSPEERTAFEDMARQLAPLPPDQSWQEPAHEVLQWYFAGVDPRMQTPPMVAIPLSRLSPSLARLLPPAPTELYAYVGEKAAGAGGLRNIPAALREYYEPLFAVG